MITSGTIRKVMTKRDAAIRLSRLIQPDMDDELREAVVVGIGALMFDDIDSDPSYVTYRTMTSPELKCNSTTI